MIQPERRRNILRAAALLTRNVPRRCVAMTLSKSPGSIIITTLSRVMPALLTTMASGPSSVSARSTMALDLLLVGDVGHDDEALAAQRLDLADDGRAGRLVGEVVDGDVGAGRGQAERDGAADAAAGAGHQRHAARQVELDAHATSQ